MRNLKLSEILSAMNFVLIKSKQDNNTLYLFDDQNGTELDTISINGHVVEEAIERLKIYIDGYFKVVIQELTGLDLSKCKDYKEIFELIKDNNKVSDDEKNIIYCLANPETIDIEEIKKASIKELKLSEILEIMDLKLRQGKEDNKLELFDCQEDEVRDCFNKNSNLAINVLDSIPALLHDYFINDITEQTGIVFNSYGNDADFKDVYQKISNSSKISEDKKCIIYNLAYPEKIDISEYIS